MLRAGTLLMAGLVAAALASSADAASRGRRARTGPLVMSGMWGPQVAAHRESARGADICKPVTIKRGGRSSAAHKFF